MSLCELRGGYLFQVRPDMFPQGFLTDKELAYWIAYYEIKNRG